MSAEEGQRAEGQGPRAEGQGPRAGNSLGPRPSALGPQPSSLGPRPSALGPQTGFFTDSTLCIGCKACEVACKEWNDVPADGFVFSGHSYDNTIGLGHSTWRHVKFVETGTTIGAGGNAPDVLSWQFSSDVCKHCEHAGCLEACPTGSIIRTEFGGVYIQPDICNGCGYCVVTCPFGVVDRRPDDGRAFKCTFCYDRQKAGEQPACAKACPTQSILFGDLEELERAADARIARLHDAGMTDANIWNPKHTSVGGTHAFFLIRGDSEQYNLPKNPEVPTVLLGAAWKSAAAAAAVIAAGALLNFALAPKPKRGTRDSRSAGRSRRRA